MILDDDPLVAEMVEDVLQQNGFETEVFTDGWSALDRAQKETFDALLVDIRMPGLTGPEFYNRLKGTSEINADRLAFLTGDALNADVAAFLENCGRPHMEKPVSPVHLISILKNLVGDP